MFVSCFYNVERLYKLTTTRGWEKQLSGNGTAEEMSVQHKPKHKLDFSFFFVVVVALRTKLRSEMRYIGIKKSRWGEEKTTTSTAMSTEKRFMNTIWSVGRCCGESNHLKLICNVVGRKNCPTKSSKEHEKELWLPIKVYSWWMASWMAFFMRCLCELDFPPSSAFVLRSWQL